MTFPSTIISRTSGKLQIGGIYTSIGKQIEKCIDVKIRDYKK